MVAKIQNNYWPLGLVLLVILSAIAISFSIGSSTQPGQLANAVAADLAITAPLLYFLLIRKTSIPNLTVVPCFLIGLLIAHLVLPPTERELLNFLTHYVLPGIELFVLFFVGRNIWRFVRELRQNGATSIDKLEVIKSSTLAVVGEGLPARLLTTELSIIYYGLFSWGQSERQSDFHFTHYKKNGLGAVIALWIMVLAAETFAVHILLMKWSVVVAWIASFSSVYLALLFIAHFKATRKRQSWIDEYGLHLRYGLSGNVDISLVQIDNIQLTSRTPRNLDQFVKLGHAFESHNVIIELKAEIEIERMYGKKEKTKAIGLMIDDREQLKEQLG
ncbi:MAG: hypothetical protein KTR30_30475 [Saprospiraceae bacterium]|nr:hypothetical protein [Saprospiraceae bacterium]